MRLGRPWRRRQRDRQRRSGAVVGWGQAAAAARYRVAPCTAVHQAAGRTGETCATPILNVRWVVRECSRGEVSVLLPSRSRPDPDRDQP
jgi:hypothetical protein